MEGDFENVVFLPILIAECLLYIYVLYQFCLKHVSVGSSPGCAMLLLVINFLDYKSDCSHIIFCCITRYYVFFSIMFLRQTWWNNNYFLFRRTTAIKEVLELLGNSLTLQCSRTLWILSLKYVFDHMPKPDWIKNCVLELVMTRFELSPFYWLIKNS